MEKFSLFLLILLVDIGNLHAQTRLISRDYPSSYSNYESIPEQTEWQLENAEKSAVEKNLSIPLMIGITTEVPIPRNISSSQEESREGTQRQQNGYLAGRSILGEPSSNSSSEEERSVQFSSATDSTILNTAITNAKDSLQQNSLELETAIASTDTQHIQELLAWKETFKKKHEEFLLQEASSYQHAQEQAQENAHFFEQQVQELQRSIGTEEPSWIVNEELLRQVQVKAFRTKLQEIEQLLKKRELLYQELSDAYTEIIKNGTEEEGIRNILLSFENQENGINGNDQRVIVGRHGTISFIDAPLAKQQEVAEGKTLIEIGIMKNFGIDGLQRFRETFYADNRYENPLIAEEVKQFINHEQQYASELHPTAIRNYFYSSIDSLDKLQKISITEHDRLVRSNDHRTHFNPFSGEEPSFHHITDPERTALEGIIAVRAALRNEDFFKNATLLKQQHILERFDKKFLTRPRKSFWDYLFFRKANEITPLTIEACNNFIQEERGKSEKWIDKIYYQSLSEPHKLAQALWSLFAASVSGERAEPPFTETDHFYRSLGIAVASAYGMNVANDWTRPARKEPEIQDDETLFELMKRECVIENPYKGFYQNFSESEKELKSQSQYNEAIANLQKRRKKLVLQMLERYTDDFQKEQTQISSSSIQDNSEPAKLISEIRAAKGDDQIQKKVDVAFQYLFDQSSEIVAYEREHLESIRQSLNNFSEYDLSQNRLCSKSEVKTMQRLFEETQSAFLLQQARFHESDQEMDQLRQTAMKNAQLFLGKAESFRRKIEGGKRTVDKMQNSTVDSGEEILTQLRPLEGLLEKADATVQTYLQLAKVYSLRIERASKKRSNEEEHSTLIDQLENLRLLDSSYYHKIIVSRNGTFRFEEPSAVSNPTHTALKQNGLALVLLAISDSQGQCGVQKVKNSIQFKRAAKKGLTVGELQNILNSKFNDRSLSYFLSPEHSIIALLKSSESENERVVRSNGRSFSYNPFSTEESFQEYLAEDEETAAEGTEECFAKISGLDFFQKMSSFNQYEILKRFSERFQGKDKEPLTVGTFKEFVEQEDWASKSWNDFRYWKNLVYYKAYHPYWLSQEWSGFMGLVTGIRYQPIFSNLPFWKKFGITWFIDVLGEYLGKSREYRDGGAYKKLVDRALNKKEVFSTQPIDIPDFEKILEEAFKEKEAKQHQGNVYQYIIAHQEYEASVQKILTIQKTFVMELLQRHLSTLSESDPKKALLSAAFQKINGIDEKSFPEKIKEEIQLFTKDANTAIIQAVNELDEVQEAIANLIDSNLEGNILFSPKEFKDLQQTLKAQLAELRLEQLRAQENSERLVKLHTLVVKNADFFSKKADELLEKLDGGYEEITDQGEDELPRMKQLSIFNKIRMEYNKAVQAYSKLADAYALKVIGQKNTPPSERGGSDQESFLSQLKSQVLPEWGEIVLDDHGHLIVSSKLNRHFGLKVSEHDRLLSAAALPRMKLEIADTLGMDALRRFENQMKLKMLANYPMIVRDIQKFLASEETQYENFPAVYITSEYSLDRLLHAPVSEQLLRSHGAKFQYNPFGKCEANFLMGDQETANEGMKIVLKNLKKMDFYKKLTHLNQQDIVAHFKERFESPAKTWTRYFKSFADEEKKPEPLTVKAFQDFIAEEIKESERLQHYYQFRDSPLAASTAWNIIAGLGVIARIDPRIIHCTPINIAFHYGGHSYLLHTITALTIFPTALHAVPGIIIAYLINSASEKWLNTRQRNIAPIR